MQRPMVWLTLIFIASIITGSLITFPFWATIAAVLILLGASIVGYFRKWQKNSILVALLIFFIGILVFQLSIERGKTDLIREAGHIVTLEGVITEEPIIKEHKVQYIVRVMFIESEQSDHSIKGKILLTLSSDRVNYSYGDNIKFRGKLEVPPSAGNSGAFDYRAYLARQGIPLTMHIWNENVIELLDTGAANPVVGMVLQAKKHFLAVTEKTLPAKEAAVVEGIIFGVTAHIDSKTQEVFRQTGVIHVLSVSGLHVALVLGVVLGIGRLCRIPKKINSIIAVVLIFLYGVMTGMGPAVLRSVIMGVILLLGDIMEREKDWLTTLAFSALIILIIDPQSIFNIGFQLSYIATWAILNITPWLNKRLIFIPVRLRNIITVPMAAQLGTIPVIAYYFNFLSPVSILANIIAVPITGLLLVLGLAATLVGLLYLPLAGFVNYTTEALTDLFLALIKLFAAIPGSVLNVPTPPLWIVFLGYGLLLVIVNIRCFDTLLLRMRRFWQLSKGTLVICSLTIIAVLVWTSVLWADTGKLKVTFIDVGQGDSILVQTPAGKNMLIDTGPAEHGFNSGEKIIIPLLHRLGIGQLDVLVLTHPHEDHIGGAQAIIDAIPVDTVIICPLEHTTNSYAELLQNIGRQNINLVTGMAGSQIDLDSNLNLSVIYPDKKIKDTNSDLNNNSLVLKLDYGQHSFLFTGDIEKEAIDRLLATGVTLSSTVFKLPHHGSNNSLVVDFYRSVHPDYGVITVGKNRFGHPAPETLKELARQGITLFRTDVDGAVTFTSDGRKLTVDTFRKGTVNGLSGTDKQF